jgi:hypothetical protein
MFKPEKCNRPSVSIGYIDGWMDGNSDLRTFEMSLNDDFIYPFIHPSGS